MRPLLAHVSIRGTLRERSVEPTVRLLRAVRERRRIRGVLLDVSSGGGGAVASHDLYLAVQRLNAVKPVVASIGTMAASGAYLAVLGARRIYAYPDSAVGSIGVLYPHFSVKRLLDRIGVDVDLIHQGRHKDAYQGYRALTEEERTKILAMAEEGYLEFVETVARARSKPVEEILPLATGEVFRGRTALRLGLIDALGDPEVALGELARLTGVSARRTVRIEPARPFLERILSGGLRSLGPAFGVGVGEALEDLAMEGWTAGGL
ncbi:MAG: signal peptide peptidase SppA [Thermoplasmata archaeon]